MKRKRYRGLGDEWISKIVESKKKKEAKMRGVRRGDENMMRRKARRIVASRKTFQCSFACARTKLFFRKAIRRDREGERSSRVLISCVPFVERAESA